MQSETTSRVPQVPPAVREHPHGGKDLLRFMTCGSVDDGKSTLIGRLLFELGQIFDDQLDALGTDSRRHGTTGEELDFALLVDGLQAEREQGITIDVAYRYFSTSRRKYIVADAPGHEQYTRNMATGASVSDLAVILVDARKGVLTQTRRHSIIVHLLGIRHIVLAINKMDLVGYDSSRFAAIRDNYLAFAEALGIPHLQCIPLAARSGDNVTTSSLSMPWYEGPNLLAYLEAVDTRTANVSEGLIMPVQWVNRPSGDFRGVSGTLARGSVRPGVSVIVLPSGQPARISRIATFEGDREAARSGDAVTLVLEPPVDAGRGDMIADPDDPPELTDQFAAHIIWLGQEPMLPGRQYTLKCATQTITSHISTLKHKVNADTLGEEAGRQLSLNEIAFCNVSCNRPVAFLPYARNRTLGAFILVDRISHQTVGAGMIQFALRRASNIPWQALDINHIARAAQKGQRAFCIWFTGLSGAGKSTIANALDRRLFAKGNHVFVLDGDNVRHGLNRDLGFTDADRVENIRRVAEVARLMVDAGLITIVALISPFRSERRMARERFAAGDFVEIFLDTPLAVCEARDAKGLYRRARAGEIKNFTGISSAYEAPEHPELWIRADAKAVDDIVEEIIEALTPRGLLPVAS